MVVAKEKLKQIKNQLWAAKEVEKTAKEAAKGAIVAPKDEKIEKPADKKVSHDGEEKTTITKPEKFELKQQVRKREQKSLAKSMKNAQLSTASMGKFDKKVKGEKEAPTSQKKKLKDRIGGNELSKLHQNLPAEKERNLKVLAMLERKKESVGGGKVKANLDADKVARQQQVKDEKKRKQK